MGTTPPKVADVLGSLAYSFHTLTTTRPSPLIPQQLPDTPLAMSLPKVRAHTLREYSRADSGGGIAAYHQGAPPTSSHDRGPINDPLASLPASHRKPRGSSPTPRPASPPRRTRTTCGTLMSPSKGPMAARSRVRPLPQRVRGPAAHEPRRARRRRFPPRALPARRVPDGAAKGAVPDQDLPPEHRCVPRPCCAAPRARSHAAPPPDKLGRICLDILKGECPHRAPRRPC